MAGSALIRLKIGVTTFGRAAAEAGQLGEAIIEGNRDFKWPVPDYHNISACFFDARDHYAIDIGTITTNADIVASYDGEVAEITRNGANDYGYGNAVMLRHTYTTSSGTITLYSRYAHMSEISESLSVGSAVVGGETVLGKTGGSGYGSANYYAVHLDFQILTSNDWLNRQTCSIDPFANNLMELPADLYLGRTSECCQSYIDAIKALYASDVHTHSYESAVTPPTCTEDGYTTYTCSCGDSYTDDEVTAPGHSWKKGDCGAAKTCSVCGATEGTIEHTEINGACSACGAISVSETNFPDDNFRKYISEKIGAASDGWLTEIELQAVTSIHVNSLDIISLKGIEFFTCIETLICGNNSLMELDLSKNTKLKSLDCQNNSLTELDLSNNTELDYLECTSNALTALDLSKNSKLDILRCSANALTELDLSGCPVLQNLYCSSNKLTSIDLSVCPTLRDLDCSNNKLTSLDVRPCRNLWILKCGTNELTSLNAEGCKSLSEFYCSNNALTSLDLSTNTMLHKLDCSNNALESITLAEKLQMETFDCSYNSLVKLELTSCTVHSFDCSYNSLVKLDLAGCTVNRLNAQNNIRVVTAEQNKFDLSTLPGFDVSKVVEVVGGTLDGSIITAEDVAVGYYYDCGNELDVGFVLVIENFCQHNWSEGNCTEVKTCSLCGATDGEAPGHDMGEWVTTENATCTTDGSKRKDCSRCDHFETEVIPAAHDMGDWYTVTEATPELDGEERRDCSRCEHFETRVTSFVDNMLKLEGEDFLDETTVYINGLPYPVVVSGDERYVELPTEEDCSIVTYDFHVGDPDDIHTQYPVGMKVYIVSDGEITYVQELDNLLQYSGSSIRITGKKGIRMITSLYKNTKSALAGKGLAGYKLVEYGTVLAFAHEVEGDGDLVLGKDYSRSNYAYKRGVSDPVYANKGDLTQYTNVLVGFNLDQCKEDLAMRPYIILENAEGEQFTVYGGTIYRSIGYVAYQNRNAVKPGTAAYNFVWEIIHHVYGDKYDSDYKG